jgi:serine protein kinase
MTANSTTENGLFARIQKRSAAPRYMTFVEYLDRCKTNKTYYATASQRLLAAIGEPKVVKTADDTRLGRIFQNRNIKVFERFADFYGIEDSIERLCGALKAAGQGLEEARQVIYLMGPVGSAKSSFAERLKELMEEQLFYVLCVQDKDVPGKYTSSPMYESPLGVIPKGEAKFIESEYGIPARLINGICSPWAVKRLREDLEGDVRGFWVEERYPSIREQVGIAEVAPGDDNNQDISDLVGKVDVRKLEEYAVNDPDAYSYSGGLCMASQGILDFIEMFKAPIKTLYPLITATQEGKFSGTEKSGAMPWRGLTLAHSNESEWDKFKSNKNNEAFLDRVKIIEVKYNLRLTEEQMIYQKIIANSELKNMPVAPYSYELLARTVIASRLTKPSEGRIDEKVLIYDGQDVRDEHPNAPTVYDFLKKAKATEGMEGLSTRVAYKILSDAANLGEEEALDPVEILAIMKRELPEAWRNYTVEQAKSWLHPRIGEMIRESLLENYSQYGQHKFERYVAMADVMENADVGVYHDPNTGMNINKADLEIKLKEIEEPAGIVNAKDFRNEVVKHVYRYKSQHNQQFPKWEQYEKMRRVIKRLIEHDTEELMDLVSFDPKRDAEQDVKHSAFIERMKKRGYTHLQVRRMVMWYRQEKFAS